jgi:hypothetical protein
MFGARLLLFRRQFCTKVGGEQRHQQQQQGVGGGASESVTRVYGALPRLRRYVKYLYKGCVFICCFDVFVLLFSNANQTGYYQKFALVLAYQFCVGAYLL